MCGLCSVGGGNQGFSMLSKHSTYGATSLNPRGNFQSRKNRKGREKHHGNLCNILVLPYTFSASIHFTTLAEFLSNLSRQSQIHYIWLAHVKNFLFSMALLWSWWINHFPILGVLSVAWHSKLSFSYLGIDIF